MERKKSRKADLERKRTIFFQIGLLFSLGIILAAFEWSSVSIIEGSFFGVEDIYQDVEITQITREIEIKPPPPPIPKPIEVLNILDNDDQIDNEYFGEDIEPEQGQEIDIYPFIDEPEVTEDLPFIFVEDMPSFRGEGLAGFRNWIVRNLKYPEIAVANGISGKVYIQFVVNSKGKVEDAVVVRKVDPSLEKEAIRVVMSSPQWVPGKQRGKAVKVLFTVPVNFVLH